MKSSEEGVDHFEFELFSWDEEQIIGQILFQKPLGVSKGDFRDDLLVRVVKPTFFVSAQNPTVILDSKNIDLISDIPR